MMTYGESPEPERRPAGSEDRVMHASLLVDRRHLMATRPPASPARAFWGEAFGMLTDRFGTPWVVMGRVSG